MDHRESFERLCEGGLEGDSKTLRITFPRAVVESAIESAPSGFSLYDRDGREHARLEGDRVHFVPASSALRILDRASGEIRDASSGDFAEYIKVADSLKNIAYLSTAFIPRDVPQDIADAWRLYLSLSYSEKPMVSSIAPTGAFRWRSFPSCCWG